MNKAPQRPAPRSALLARLRPREMDSLLGSMARYTRFVLFGKWFLAFVALGLALTLIALPLGQSDKNGFRLTLSGNNTPENAPPQMVNPRFQGVDEKNQPYTVTAKSAAQADANTVVLTELNADISLKDTSWLAVMAESGTFRLDSKQLILIGKVQLFYDQGYELNTDRVEVNVPAKTATSRNATTGSGPLGTLAAAGFDAEAASSSIRFLGPVKVTIYGK